VVEVVEVVEELELPDEPELPEEPELPDEPDEELVVFPVVVCEQSSILKVPVQLMVP